MDRVAAAAALRKAGVVFSKMGLPGVKRAGKAFLRIVLGRKLEIRMDGLTLAGAVEHAPYLSALRAHEKEPFSTELFSDAIRPGMFVVDIGAFIGWYALLAAAGVGTRGRVYAFEPDPRNHAWLAENIQRNGFGDIIVPERSAVAATNETLPFFLQGGDQTTSSLLPLGSPLTSTSAHCTRLDDYLDPGVRIDVVKMDIEGAECRALEGMTRTIASAGDDLTMVVECNPRALAAAGDTPETLIEMLEEMGMEVSAVVERDRRLVPLSERRDETMNLYCSRRSN